MNYKAHAEKLLHEWALCNTARPKNNIVVDFQIEKDACSIWAVQLIHALNWGSELELAEACNQLESRLKPLKQKLVIEVLKNGTV
jgi:hypothetical protein